MRTLYVEEGEDFWDFEDSKGVFYVDTDGWHFGEVVWSKVADVPEDTSVYITLDGAQEFLDGWRALKRAR